MGTRASTVTVLDSVTAYLSDDHDRLGALLTKIMSLAERNTFAEAARLFAEFESGLDRHIRIEEELLFPVFEVRSGLSSGPTTVMRLEHREIRRSVALLGAGLARQDAPQCREARTSLETLIPEHNAKEEHILYPTTDSLLAPAERAAFLARLRSE